ncbi:uncharacterized protein LOC135082605 [Ostrinia nubilalis]|uniref:uncharacterized protein LOC135082605 n=1 Tax=Ostrinia nubilalis TaxID=29057 RepID=UPI0030822F94
MDNLFHKCRLCLKLGDFCSIFEQDDSIKLSEMVMAFTNLKISEGDGLSDRVCTSCIENLSTAYLFKLQCERIDTLLRTCPDAQLEKPAATDYNDLFNQEFHMHTIYGSVEGENDENNVKDSNPTPEPLGNIHEVSDETDSDMDSIKCAQCSQSYSNQGAHICNVTCTIEHYDLQRSSSNETLVAVDAPPAIKNPFIKPIDTPVIVSCVLCDNKYEDYDDYVIHINKCTTNVKLHHYVCPVCHEICTAKLAYLQHLKDVHFKKEEVVSDEPSVDVVDSFTAIYEKSRKPKSVRRQIGWSIEDIYQEIDCKKVEEKVTPTSSPLKTFFSRLGNESLSRQSTPKRVSFRKLIETGKAKTSNYIPFRKYIQNYKEKKKATNYSPIEGKMQLSSKIRLSMPGGTSDSDYGTVSGTSEESWRMKQNLICACDKKVFMLSESVHDRDRIVSMINELGGVVAENTKMEMLATHFISVLPNDTYTGMMVCALATGKWLLHISFVYDSFRCKKFMDESIYEWMRHPKILEIDNTSVEVAKAAVYWHLELQALSAKFPFEGKQVVLIMRKKYRQYYNMVFKTLKAKPITYDPRTPGSCCSADYCFVDMKMIERVKLRFFARHQVPVFPYQYILVYLLKKGNVDDEHKYLLQECKRIPSRDTVDYLNLTY